MATEQETVGKSVRSGNGSGKETGATVASVDPFIVEARKWDVLDDDALHEAISKLAEEDSGDVARAFMRRGRTFAIEMVADIHHAGGGHLFE